MLLCRCVPECGYGTIATLYINVGYDNESHKPSTLLLFFLLTLKLSLLNLKRLRPEPPRGQNSDWTLFLNPKSSIMGSSPMWYIFWPQGGVLHSETTVEACAVEVQGDTSHITGTSPRRISAKSEA